jgi:hypothetical protein
VVLEIIDSRAVTSGYESGSGTYVEWSEQAGVGNLRRTEKICKVTEVSSKEFTSGTRERLTLGASKKGLKMP